MDDRPSQSAADVCVKERQHVRQCVDEVSRQLGIRCLPDDHQQGRLVLDVAASSLGL